MTMRKEALPNLQQPSLTSHCTVSDCEHAVFQGHGDASKCVVDSGPKLNPDQDARPFE